jgi:TatD DNase family protein
MGLADVHAHLTHPTLAAGAGEIIARARAAGVTSIVVNGLNHADNAAVLALASQHPDIVRPALGLYPVDAVLPELRALGHDYPREVAETTVEATVAWLRDHAGDAIAIGEIGLDGHWVPETLWARQEAVFRELLALARDAGKPVVLHTRRRERRAFEIVREMGIARANFHCFGGKIALARAVAEAGYYLSVPANARRAESFTRMLETLPRDRLLLETDCPYLSPDRARPSEPADVAGTAQYAASLWRVPVAEVVARTEENFARLFGCAP